MAISTGNKKLDCFTSNLIFPRIATPDMDNTKPRVTVDSFTSDKFAINADNKHSLISSYSILIGRIMTKMPAFSWLAKVLPIHIPHQYSEYMEKKSKIFPLQLMFSNESAYEDVFDIMDQYMNDVTRLYQAAYGIPCYYVYR